MVAVVFYFSKEKVDPKSADRIKCLSESYGEFQSIVNELTPESINLYSIEALTALFNFKLKHVNMIDLFTQIENVRNRGSLAGDYSYYKDYMHLLFLSSLVNEMKQDNFKYIWIEKRANFI